MFISILSLSVYGCVRLWAVWAVVFVTRHSPSPVGVGWCWLVGWLLSSAVINFVVLCVLYTVCIQILQTVCFLCYPSLKCDSDRRFCVFAYALSPTVLSLLFSGVWYGKNTFSFHFTSSAAAVLPLPALCLLLCPRYLDSAQISERDAARRWSQRETPRERRGGHHQQAKISKKWMQYTHQTCLYGLL